MKRLTAQEGFAISYLLGFQTDITVLTNHWPKEGVAPQNVIPALDHLTQSPLEPDLLIAQRSVPVG